MTRDERACFVSTYNILEAHGHYAPQPTDLAAIAWLQDRSTNMPELSSLNETTRRDSMFWADLATPYELQCYMLAASTRLAGLGSMFHSRYIKQLIAALYKMMTPDEQAAFMAWVQKQEK